MPIPVGEYIRDRRLQSGISQADLAARLDLADDGYISAVERGDSIPPHSFVRRVAESLRLSAAERTRLFSLAAKTETQDSELQGPYRGLAAFRERDTGVYFGREASAAMLRSKLAQSAVVSIVGASGSGKSSLVYAGVLPRLREEKEWAVIGMRPGSRPFDSLAVALLPILSPDVASTDIPAQARALGKELAAGGAYAAFEVVVRNTPHAETVLLFLDQFEELYTQCSNPTEVRSFIDTVLEVAHAHASAGSVKCLLTLRGDFYGYVVGYAPLAEALQDNVVNLPPMLVPDLLRAIEEPARLFGGLFEPGLVDRILADAGQEPGVLPLLEYCLTLLWNTRQGVYLTYDAYEEVGGLQGAIASQAENVFQQLGEARRLTMRQVLTRLVRLAGPDQEGSDARRRTSVSEFDSLPGASAVVQALVNSRLLCTDYDRVAGAETVEIVHEAVIRSWVRLNTWLSEDREFLLWLERVRFMLRQWEDAGRDDAVALRGKSLALAEDWVSQRKDEVDPSVREFVSLSSGVAEREVRMRALEQADFLVSAQAEEVPRLIELLRMQSKWVDPRLREMLQDASTGGERWRVRLALVERDRGLLPELREDLLHVVPHDFVVLCMSLRAYADDISESLWAAALDLDSGREQRFRATCALGQYDPGNARWSEISNLAVECIAAENSLYVREWLRVLWPVRHLLIDGLFNLLRDSQQRDGVRETVALILAQFLEDDSAALARVVCETPTQVYESVFRTITQQGAGQEDAAQAFLAIVRESPAKGSSQIERVDVGRRRGVAAISLVRMGREGLSELFTPGDDVEAATQLCHQCRERGVPASVIAGLVLRTETSDQRYSLVLALGEFPKEELDRNVFALVAAELETWYRTDPHPGVHAAVGWLLLRWGFSSEVDEVDCMTVTADEIGDRSWFTMRAGRSTYPFVTVPPGMFVMGSPEGECERKSDEGPQHEVRIHHPLAVCSREISRDEYEEFVEAAGREGLPEIDDWSPYGTCPVVGITWFEAEAFCGWLGGALGLALGGDVTSGTARRADGRGTAVSGVRLLTEAEWERVCRAGSVTAFSFGGEESYLNRYGWFDMNAGYQTHPARELRPNRFGVFNMHGNCWEWCGDWYGPYRGHAEVEPTGSIPSPWRVLRGGCWNLNARYSRSARRARHVPTNRNWYDGLRVCFEL